MPMLPISLKCFPFSTQVQNDSQDVKSAVNELVSDVKTNYGLIAGLFCGQQLVVNTQADKL